MQMNFNLTEQYINTFYIVTSLGIQYGRKITTTKKIIKRRFIF